MDKYKCNLFDKNFLERGYLLNILGIYDVDWKL